MDIATIPLAAAAVEAFGLDLGTPFQGGILATLIAILGFVARSYIVTIPERTRAENERRGIETKEATERYREWRLEIHELKNEIGKVSAKQVLVTNELSEALVQNRHNESQMKTMLFLIKLLISELKRLDPHSIIVHQAEATLQQLNEHIIDPLKSDALNTAEGAVQDAKQTLVSTRSTRDEVVRSESEGK